MAKSRDHDTYYPQSGEYGGYCGNLNELDDREEYKKRDTKVDDTRAEFGRPKPSKGVSD